MSDDQKGQKGQGIVPAGHGEAHDGEAHDGEAEDANLQNCELESISTMPLTELCMCCKKKVKLLAAGVKKGILYQHQCWYKNVTIISTMCRYRFLCPV